VLFVAFVLVPVGFFYVLYLCVGVVEFFLLLFVLVIVLVARRDDRLGARRRWRGAVGAMAAPVPRARNSSSRKRLSAVTIARS
jgi:uncharacterized membrane protein YedE/YeeE